MAELITEYSVERDALLYVMSGCKPKGWRVDLLAEKISESEEQLLLCSCCNGLLRDACLYEKNLFQRVLSGYRFKRLKKCFPENGNLLVVTYL